MAKYTNSRIEGGKLSTKMQVDGKIWSYHLTTPSIYFQMWKKKIETVVTLLELRMRIAALLSPLNLISMPLDMGRLCAMKKMLP